MLFSIVKSKRILEAMPLIPEVLRDDIRRLVGLHRLLMCFFLLGYVVVLVGFASRLAVLSNFLVSLIFLFGAIFVFMGIAIETRLLSEIHKTTRGILPTCAHCKKIRREGEKEEDAASWVPLETYIREHSDAHFSHALCPDCIREHYDEDVQRAYFSEEHAQEGSPDAEQ